MKTFIVAREPYTRYGGAEPPELDAHRAENLDDLVARVLCPGLCPTAAEWDAEDVTMPTPAEWLREANGDGMDYFIVKELLPDGTLGPDLTEYPENADSAAAE